MPEYKAMYFEVFNRISDVTGLLKKAQQAKESAYIESSKPICLYAAEKIGQDGENNAK